MSCEASAGKKDACDGIHLKVKNNRTQPRRPRISHTTHIRLAVALVIRIRNIIIIICTRILFKCVIKYDLRSSLFGIVKFCSSAVQ